MTQDIEAWFNYSAQMVLYTVQLTIIVQQLVDQVHVSQEHSPAAISLETQFIQYFTI